MRMFLVGIAVIAIIAFRIVNGRSETLEPMPTPVTLSGGEPIVTIIPTQTPLPTATLAPLVHGDAERMRFAVGTYGSSYTLDSTVKTFVLWAAQDQKLRLAGDSTMRARLTTASGEDVYPVGGVVTLPVSGDYMLTVTGTRQFAIDIR